MKKIFTLLVAVSIISLAQAQSGYGKNGQHEQRNNSSGAGKDYHQGYDNGKDIAFNKDNDGRYNGIMSPERQRDLEIARINRDYDWKIQKVNDSFFKSRSQKKRQVRSLQAQRQREIKSVYARFADDIRHYHNDRSDRRY